MISFSNDPVMEDREHGEGVGEPRAVGQLMAAVLARYGIAASVETERPRLPRLEHQSTQLGGLLSVG